MKTTIEILKDCRVVGNNIKLPDQLLDYKGEYLPLKKKLEGIGGKWQGGKTEAFVFDSDPTELLGSLQGGKEINFKHDFQFFPTPNDLGMHLIGLSPISLTTPNIRVLEPSAGDGALIACIHEINSDITIDCFELMEQNRKKIAKLDKANLVGNDFLNDSKASEGFAQFDFYDLIIANPPFSKNQDIDHIYQMYRCLKVGGALVTIASKSWTFGDQRKQVTFKGWLTAIGAYIEEIDAGKFKQSGTMVGAMIISLTKKSEHLEIFPETIEAEVLSKTPTPDVNIDKPIWTEDQLKSMNATVRKPMAIGLQETEQSAEEIAADIETSLSQALQSIKSVKHSLKSTTEEEMNFFNQLSEIIGQSEISLTIKPSGDRLTVMAFAKESNVKPLIVTGTATELDEGFFGELSIPVVKMTGLKSNASSIEETETDKTETPKKKAPAKSKAKVDEKAEEISDKDVEAEKERIAKEKAEADTLALEEENRAKAEQERIDNYDKLIATAKKQEEEKEFKAAAVTTKSAKEFSLAPEELDARIKELMQKHFDAEMAGI